MDNFGKNILSEAHYLNQHSPSSTSLFELELGDADVAFRTLAKVNIPDEYGYL